MGESVLLANCQISIYTSIIVAGWVWYTNLDYLTISIIQPSRCAIDKFLSGMFGGKF